MTVVSHKHFSFSFGLFDKIWSCKNCRGDLFDNEFQLTFVMFAVCTVSLHCVFRNVIWQATTKYAYK